MTLKDHLHKEFPKTCAPDDFFGQVKRTINGKPVPQEQIDMIIAAIGNNLNLKEDDVLLDICAGNGALVQGFFSGIKAYLGVDFSEYLIGVAKNNFEKLPDFRFIVSDALEYSVNEKQPENFTKALCYGAFQYLPQEAAEGLLKNLYDRFKNLKSFFIGNLPDKDRADKFYYADIDYKPLLSDHTTALGIWRSKAEMKTLAEKHGWKAEIIDMPASFYVSHYRYDIKLTRQ